MDIADGVPEFSGRVRRSYARIAGRYDRRWRAYLRDTLEPTLAALAPKAGERILDVGCGTGRLAADLTRLRPGLDVWCVDLSPEMLGLAARAGADPHHARFAVGDAAGLPFASRTFDAVVSSSSLHHWSRPEEALDEIARVTREGGRLVITDWCRDVGVFRPLAVALRLFDRTVWRVYSRAEAEALISAAGFQIRSASVYRGASYWGLMTITAIRDRARPAARSGGRR